LPDVTLTLVPWAPGTSVGAYPRRSEQTLPNQPPTMVEVADSEPVTDDASLTFLGLDPGEYWAAAPLGELWQYVAFNAEDSAGGSVLPSGPPVVSVLPASPSDGDEIYYVVPGAAYAIWHLRWDTAVWEFLGGTPLAVIDDAGPYTNNGLSYVAVGSQLTVPVAGYYEASLSGKLYSASSSGVHSIMAALGVDGAANLRVGAQKYGTSEISSGDPITFGCGPVPLALPAGAVIRAMLACTGGNTVTLRNSGIVIRPLLLEGAQPV
jgi:hypothetical protein